MDRIKEFYQGAKEEYAKIGVDTDQALHRLEKVKISMHCWQGDDVAGFDRKGALSGGIQTTGNYPGKPRTPEELMQDMDQALSLIPGKHKLNLHANYAIFNEGEWVDRDQLEPKHFAKWVEFAKARGLGLDFNPTLFSHPKAQANGTLTSVDEEIRQFWIRHCQACIRISEYFANEIGQPCVMNIWIPDGLKDVPADRLGPRRRYKESLDQILAIPYDKSKVFVTLESKVFGIGLESYTAGSAEFCLNYVNAAGITPLMDNGHYHPTEWVSDKVSSMLLFHQNLALHITRPVRWDSDHVVLFDDETREILKEIVANDALGRVFLATDFFDASINRVGAWVTGLRNVQKALLYALLVPHSRLKALQDEGRMGELMACQEEQKTMPFGLVWNYFLQTHGVAQADWYEQIKQYEAEVLQKRQ